jgi:predicted Zn-dependent protease
MNKLPLIIAACLLVASCAAVEKGVDALASQGRISETDRDALLRTGEALRSSFADITEEEEYYIGRSVAALVLDRYKAYDNEALTRYVNTVGQAVVYSSDRPETFAGYHFLVLDTDEVNAMAAPGGFIFITRGLLRRCANEEMLAAVLAHEVGHVAARHGLQSIKKARLVEAFKLLGSEAARRSGSEELAKLAGVFEDVLGDVVTTLVERGYDRKFEYEADGSALKFMAGTGYAPSGLTGFLEVLKKEAPASGGLGWFKTHPAPADRLDRAGKTLAAMQNAPSEQSVRTERFRRSMSAMK